MTILSRGAAALAIALALAACDGLITGEKALSLPVEVNAQGGYGPLRLALTPDQSPVALNLRAEHAVNIADQVKWNSYIATLTFNGREVAAGKFTINYQGGPEGQPGAPQILQNMLTARVAEAGDYELVVAPIKPIEVKLSNVRIEMRAKVEGNANLR
ncbi:MAG TPA: hypothetical protein VFV17_03200 [Usitatibacteraceae bacterium]|nr:hypothetical protein [Usitatibacteraceae bacterium]